MKKILFYIFAVVSMMMSTSCTLTKHLTYFQNIDTVDIAKENMPVIRVKPNDELTINVSSITPEAAQPFNMHSSMSNNNQNANIYSYIVDPDGNINYPVLGQVHVGGLTRPEVEEKLTQLIKPYFAENENPVVKARISNFKVTVLGAIGTSVMTVDHERMSIIEAIARSGDLDIYGKRPNILLVRENDRGEKMTARFNLNDANIFNSPYYFLQQNDIIYVEPLKIKARSADISSWTFWTPITSMALSLSTMVISLSKK